jgi:hypothetical protein
MAVGVAVALILMPIEVVAEESEARTEGSLYFEENESEVQPVAGYQGRDDGEWIWTSEYGYVWHPWVSSGRRPYYNDYYNDYYADSYYGNGRWGWYPSYGWEWIPYGNYGYWGGWYGPGVGGGHLGRFRGHGGGFVGHGGRSGGHGGGGGGHR